MTPGEFSLAVGELRGTLAEIRDRSGRRALEAVVSEAERLRSALAGLVEACRHPGEGATEGFERIAEAFYRDTGMLRPGKSQPDAMNGTPTDEQREAAFKAWVEGRVDAARKALA